MIYFLLIKRKYIYSWIDFPEIFFFTFVATIVSIKKFIYIYKVIIGVIHISYLIKETKLLQVSLNIPPGFMIYSI